MNTELRKRKSVSDAKIRGKSVNVIEDNFKKNDRDNPGKNTIETICIFRTANQTSVFHIAKYIELDELKHIDCKTCESSWRFDSGRPLENQFIIEFVSDKEEKIEREFRRYIRIQCLNCNATYELSETVTDL
jgi:hypothetical protein